MFDRTIILAWFIYFLGCQQPYLIRTKSTKGAKNTKNTFAEDASISNISTIAILSKRFLLEVFLNKVFVLVLMLNYVAQAGNYYQ